MQSSPRPNYEGNPTPNAHQVDKLLHRTPMGGHQFNEDFLAPSNKYNSKTHPLGISREASNIFDNSKQREGANRMVQD
jgi:hypothetical protein